ncbi:MAG: hypothetical protein JSR69_22000 [Proteobacteria bacterium]|nr:hypothetical protein [Pseudomonadota bacterium]
MRKPPPFDLPQYELEDDELLQDDMLVFVPKNSFRIHPDKTRTSRVLLSRYDNQRWWLINKSIARTYRVPKLWRARLYHAALEDGTNFLLPVTEPRSSGSDWHDSLNQAVKLGRKQWVRAIPEEDCYRLETPNIRREPQWMEGEWPDFMEAAFDSLRIDTDHQAIGLFRPRAKSIITEEE